MATRVVNPSHEDPPDSRPAVIPPCSICDGSMVLAYDRYQQKVCVCTDCHTSITIPGSAWQIANRKRESRKFDTVDRRRHSRRATDIQLSA
jgi:hypothetical protein